MPLHTSNLLILLPAFNEDKMIQKVIFTINQAGYPNICVINDGSTDYTLQNAQSTGATVLTHFINRGAGAAIQTGIAYARKHLYEYVLMMDSDGQHLVEDIENLCNAMKNTEADIVVGNRFSLKNNSIPRHRIFYNFVANIFTNLFCRNRYKDTQSGFRLLNRKAIDSLELRSRGFAFCSEMLIQADQKELQVVETPIRVVYSDYSMSKGQNLFVGIKTAFDILWHK